mmetsp:Transcript_52098/g.82691  ORF Transcript_52098/g.82691 Transcript_52098/m.82691 type:complete len:231 (-) Transcript_52098:398-1090(-)
MGNCACFDGLSLKRKIEDETFKRSSESRISLVSSISNGEFASRAIVVMGVSGSGKSTTAKKLLERMEELGCPVTPASFIEGDDYHPAENRSKMAQDIALSDDDRKPWLKSLHDELQRRMKNGEFAVLACSALKDHYRELIRGESKDVLFVYLDVPKEELRRRLEERAKKEPAHFARGGLLDSQLAALERPSASSGVIIIDCDTHKTEEAIVRAVIKDIDQVCQGKVRRGQ